MAGLKFQPQEKSEFGIDFSWMQAEAALDPFELSAPDYVATHPSMAFDLSLIHI